MIGFSYFSLSLPVEIREKIESVSDYLYLYLHFCLSICICRYMFETCLKVADSFSAYFLFVHFNVFFLWLLTNLVPSFCLCVLCGNRFPFHVELFMSPQKWFSITLMWNKEISFLPRSFISTSLLHFTSLPSALFLETSHFLKQEKMGNWSLSKFTFRH